MPQLDSAWKQDKAAQVPPYTVVWGEWVFVSFKCFPGAQVRNLKNIVKGATDPRSDQQLICQHQQKHKLRIYSPSKIMGQYFVPKFWNHMIIWGSIRSGYSLSPEKRQILETFGLKLDPDLTLTKVVELNILPVKFFFHPLQLLWSEDSPAS